MKKARAIIFLLICGLLISSCTSFLKKSDESRIKEYEKKEYILKEDTGEGSRSIKKGEKIKLHIVTGDDSIKVYAYPSRTDFLKSERTLILYMFEDDFKKSKFDMTLFEDKLYSKVTAANK